MSEPWLKKAEVARELQVSERTVTRHIRPSGIVGGQNLPDPDGPRDSDG